jgi:glycosyltransferase involved in cell wall biosynthesis
MVTVSILIPVHNGEQFIAQAIQSCLDQTFTDIEVLIHNDGSTDNTIHKLLTFSDKRIVIVHRIKNIGKAAGLNSLLPLANGEFISVLDSDDYYRKDKLERQVAFLNNNPNIDAVYGDYEIIRDDQKEIRKALPQIDYLKGLQHTALHNTDPHIRPNKMLSDKGNIPSCSALIRKKVFESCLFDEQCFIEDYDFWFQMIGKGLQLAYLPGVTYTYRKGLETQKVAQKEKMDKASTYILDKLTSGKYFALK